jgi:heme O synthase-like polyprenyltransferase
MSHRSALTELSSAAVQRRRLAGSTLLSDYWTLTKPEVNFLILITTFVGYYLASANDGQPFSFAGLFNTLLGTLLVASGTGALNQYVERKFDAQMRRTARRPAAAGRLTPSAVLAFGTALAVTGGIYPAIAVNLLAGALAILTLLTYVFLYTPLKRKTPMADDLARAMVDLAVRGAEKRQSLVLENRDIRAMVESFYTPVDPAI